MNNHSATGATESIDSAIAARILNALKNNKGLTQEGLAQAIGVSYTTLRRGLEQRRGDRRSFTTLELGKIAAALGVHPSTLLPPELTTEVAA
jgi:transcriptional regulator with XRE-family HTH domain